MTTETTPTFTNEKLSILTALMAAVMKYGATNNPGYKLGQAVLPTKSDHVVLEVTGAQPYRDSNGRIVPLIALWNREEGDKRLDAVAAPADTGRAWIIAQYKLDEVNDLADTVELEWPPDSTEWIFDDDPQYGILREALEHYLKHGFAASKPNLWIVVMKDIFQ